jgi:catechol 2,3-dioxygenase
MTRHVNRIHPDTRLGSVHLTVTDLDRSLAFYRERLGFQLHRHEGTTAYLGAGQADLLILTGQPHARQLSGTTGLYHFALLLPNRPALARSLQRLAETRTPVQGFADHGVSEAIYLPDPDGHGIELYRDRPRAEWPVDRGRLQMVTDPLNVDDLLAELAGQPTPENGLPPETILGHMHLHVAHIDQAEAFYRDMLGFELMQRYGPTASFLAAGGYHHHVGVNTWAGPNAPPPPADAVGLRWFTICLPEQADLDKVVARLREAGVTPEERTEGLFLRDPSENGLILAIA